jgi:hypothetical protein
MRTLTVLAAALLTFGTLTATAQKNTPAPSVPPSAAVPAAATPTATPAPAAAVTPPAKDKSKHSRSGTAVN